MVGDLPLNLLLAVLKQLPVDEVVYGGIRDASPQLASGVQAYVGELRDLDLRPDLPVWVAAAARRLRTLTVETDGDTNALDAALAVVLGRSTHLTAVTFRGRSVALSTLRTVVEGCPALRSLSLAGCNITDQHLERLVEFRDLNVLDLSGCRRLTDAGIRALARGKAQLHALYLAGCLPISDRALETVTDHVGGGGGVFERLRILDLSGTDVSRDGLDLVRDRCPHIDEIRAVDCFRVGVCRSSSTLLEAFSAADMPRAWSRVM